MVEEDVEEWLFLRVYKQMPALSQIHFNDGSFLHSLISIEEKI